MITQDKLDKIEHGTVFAKGEFDAKGYSLMGGKRQWIALKLGDKWTVRWHTGDTDFIVKHGEPMDWRKAREVANASDDAELSYWMTSGTGTEDLV